MPLCCCGGKGGGKEKEDTGVNDDIRVKDDIGDKDGVGGKGGSGIEGKEESEGGGGGGSVAGDKLESSVHSFEDGGSFVDHRPSGTLSRLESKDNASAIGKSSNKSIHTENSRTSQTHTPRISEKVPKSEKVSKSEKVPKSPFGSSRGSRAQLHKESDVFKFKTHKVEMQKHKIREFRIVLPMSVDDYRVGQLWSVAETSKNETGGGEGVEVMRNEPFDLKNLPADKKYMMPQTDLQANGKKYTTGQYTFKVYHFESRVPKVIKMAAPKGSLYCFEEAWNAYPYCRTVITNEYLDKNMYVVIESFHHGDNGSSPNIHGLKGRDLEQRQVVKIDVANDKVDKKDYKEEWDPCKVAAPKAGRPAPLPHDKTGEWMNHVKPVMCCYKLVKVWFKWWGLQNKMENFILTQEHRLFTNFHRQVVCWQDNFTGMTIADIRRLEEQTIQELERQRKEGPLRGTTAEDV